MRSSGLPTSTCSRIFENNPRISSCREHRIGPTGGQGGLMTASVSPPTSRGVDVMGLFARSDGRQLRFSDVVRELELTQATANAILKTLCERRGLSRAPVDKTYAIGPEFIVLAAQADASRALTHAARAVALELAGDTGYATSVAELVGDALVITALHESADVPRALLGDRFPYAPP